MDNWELVEECFGSVRAAIDLFNKQNEKYAKDRDGGKPCFSFYNDDHCSWEIDGECVADDQNCACHYGPTRWERRYLPIVMAEAWMARSLAMMLVRSSFETDYSPKLDSPYARALEIFYFFAEECNVDILAIDGYAA